MSGGHGHGGHGGLGRLALGALLVRLFAGSHGRGGHHPYRGPRVGMVAVVAVLVLAVAGSCWARGAAARWGRAVESYAPSAEYRRLHQAAKSWQDKDFH